MAVGGQHTVLVDDCSNVYCWGMGDLGQLGNNSRKQEMQPVRLESMAQVLLHEQVGGVR